MIFNLDLDFFPNHFPRADSCSLWLTSCELHESIITACTLYNVQVLRKFFAHWKSQRRREQMIHKCYYAAREISMVICCKYEITSKSVLKFMFIIVNILDTQLEQIERKAISTTQKQWALEIHLLMFNTYTDGWGMCDWSILIKLSLLFIIDRIIHQTSSAHVFIPRGRTTKNIPSISSNLGNSIWPNPNYLDFLILKWCLVSLNDYLELISVLKVNPGQYWTGLGESCALSNLWHTPKLTFRNVDGQI